MKLKKGRNFHPTNDVYEILGAVIHTPSSDVVLCVLGRSDFLDAAARTSGVVGRPIFVYAAASAIHFCPTADADYEIEVKYLPHPKTL